MAKNKINYQDELILSLKRENSLLRSIKFPAMVCKVNKVEIDKFLEDLNKPGQIIVDQSKSSDDETTPRDFTKPEWRLFHFGKEEYELATADKNGVLVFRDAIFEAPFDDKEDCTNDWEKCTLKPLLLKWFEDNAPQILKDNYDVDLLSEEEIFGENKLEMFKDWHNRIKGLKGEEHSTWWWTKTAYRGYVPNAIHVSPAGYRNYSGASGSLGVVPCLRPKHQK